MKKTLLVFMVLVLLMVTIAPAAFAFFRPAICDVADAYPSAWGVVCLVAWLMDMWIDPLDGSPL